MNRNRELLPMKISSSICERIASRLEFITNIFHSEHLHVSRTNPPPKNASVAINFVSPLFSILIFSCYFSFFNTFLAISLVVLMLKFYFKCGVQYYFHIGFQRTLETISDSNQRTLLVLQPRKLTYQRFTHRQL